MDAEARISALEREVMMQSALNLMLGTALTWLWRDVARASPDVRAALEQRAKDMVVSDIMLKHSDPAQANFVSSEVRENLLALFARIQRGLPPHQSDQGSR